MHVCNKYICACEILLVTSLRWTINLLVLKIYKYWISSTKLNHFLPILSFKMDQDFLIILCYL